MEKPCVYCSFTSAERPEHGLPESHVKQLEEYFEIAWHRDVVADERLASRVVAAVFVGPFCEELFDNLQLMPSIKIIANYGAGTDRIVSRAEVLKERHILVSNTPDVVSDSTADMGLALMLASARQLVKGVRIAMTGDEAVLPTTDFGIDVSGATLGIVGMGRIGLKVAERAKAFGMKISYHNRRKRPSGEEQQVSATYCEHLHDLLKEADFIMVTCPSTPSTVGLIGQREFSLMKPTATIVNIARGNIINTAALVEALSSKRIRAAALDVTDPEPLPIGHPLRSLPNAIVVPHWGTHTTATRLRMLQLCIDNILACLRGEPLLTEVRL